MKIRVQLDQRSSGATKNGFPIIVCATDNYHQKKWRTGRYAKKPQWNDRLAVPSNKHPDYYMLLDYLQSLKIRVSEVLLSSAKRPMSMGDVKLALFRKNHTVFFDASIDWLPKDYKGTKYSALNSFNTYYPAATFLEINREKVDAYIRKMHIKGNSPGGIDSYLRSLRALWNKVTTEPNPFSKITIEIPDKIKTVATTADLIVLRKFQKERIYLDKNEKEKKIPISKGNSGFVNYCNYWLLMFYLGGIDPEVLKRLRYDKHVIAGRCVFNRDKGRSKTACNNIVPPEAFEILKEYDCFPYLVPIFKTRVDKTFSANFAERMKDLSKKLNLSTLLKPKSARYTFIDTAQQLLIDERVVAQIVGHKRKTTTSLYTNDFPQLLQDTAHLKIINFKSAVDSSLESTTSSK